MTYHYLLFDFDLPYGEKLPVITTVTEDEKAWLEKLDSSTYTDDDYISFDGAYVSLPSFIDSLTFVELTKKLPIGRQDHIIEAIKQATADPIELRPWADPDKNACPKCHQHRENGNHCDNCVEIVYDPDNIRKEHYVYIKKLRDITGLTDSTTTVTHNKVTISSIDTKSSKPYEFNLDLSPYRYQRLWHGLYYYVNAERIDIKRIYRPDKANDLLVITITERKDPW